MTVTFIPAVSACEGTFLAFIQSIFESSDRTGIDTFILVNKEAVSAFFTEFKIMREAFTAFVILTGLADSIYVRVTNGTGTNASIIIDYPSFLTLITSVVMRATLNAVDIIARHTCCEGLRFSPESGAAVFNAGVSLG